MKKILLLVALVLLPVIGFSQNDGLFSLENGKHLTFRDVPIDGSLNAFIAQIEVKGFTSLYTADDYQGAVLSGRFIGKDVKLIIITTPKTKTVWKVAVKFEDQRNWYSLKSDYTELKSSLTVKYGGPTSYEFFSSPYEEGDGYEMTAIYAEKCVYTSFFEIKENGVVIGYLSLSINKNDSQGYVSLSYEDSTNAAIMRSEKDANMYDEL